mgnify:CR=1 FL=1
MLVTHIEISQYAYDRSSARYQAVVAMTLKNQVVDLFCQVDLPENDNPRSRTVAFISDAVRQMKRMPEIRSGQKTLSFSSELGHLTV